MTALRFAQSELRQELESLEKRYRAAFAAACAQRLLSSYVRYCTNNRADELDLLTGILDRLWRAIEGGSDSTQLQKDVDLCLSLMPIDQADTDPNRLCAENAIASIAYAIRTQLSGDSQEAVWAAARAYETVDGYVISRLNRTIVDRDIEPQILAHPLIQSELQKQRRDLVEMRDLAKNSKEYRAIIADIRRRAEREPMDLA
jgi:uncharacterized protein YjaG (DUF416 family)